MVAGNSSSTRWFAENGSITARPAPQTLSIMEDLLVNMTTAMNFVLGCQLNALADLAAIDAGI